METTSSPMVSVVTPVYNNAEHLEECIESVLAQTYANWDYTIVNNCSTDGSGEIARRYAASDSRIRVIDNQQFLRAIPNHNHALRQVSPGSKYCKVVFADDWLFPECLERMVALAEQHPSVGMVGAYALEGTRVAWTGLPYEKSIVSGREICRDHFLRRLYVFGTATSVLYRSDLVRARDPFFNESNIHADTEVCFDLLKTSDFGFVHQVLTFTRVRPASLSAMSDDLQTSLPGFLHTLSTYGPAYLNEQEFEKRLRQHVSDYYEFLGKSWLLGRDKKFWQYHRKQLSESHVGYSRARVLVSALKVGFKAAISPGETIAKLKTRGQFELPTQDQSVPQSVPISEFTKGKQPHEG